MDNVGIIDLNSLLGLKGECLVSFHIHYQYDKTQIGGSVIQI